MVPAEILLFRLFMVCPFSRRCRACVGVSVTDGQGLGAVVQLGARAIAAQGVIAFVEILQVFQACGVDAALLDVVGAGLVEPVVHDGQKAVLDGPVLGDLFDQVAPADAQQPDGSLHPVGRDVGKNLLHWSHPLTCPSPARWMMPA